VETGAPAAVPPKHPDWVNSAKLTPDSRYLITTCRDQTVRLWDWQDPGKVLLAFEHTKKDAINARVSPDGNWIIAQSTDRAAQACDRQTGQAVVSSRLLSGPERIPFFSSDGRYRILEKQAHSDSSLASISSP
jgi:WD40 repeat protein